MNLNYVLVCVSFYAACRYKSYTAIGYTDWFIPTMVQEVNLNVEYEQFSIGTIIENVTVVVIKINMISINGLSGFYQLKHFIWEKA